MNANLDLRLDRTDTFGAEFYLYARGGSKRSGRTLKLDVERGDSEALNVLGALDMTLNACDLHHAEVTLSSEVEGATWTRRLTLALGRKVTLKLPDFLGDTNAAPVIEAINDVNLDGTETATVTLTASDPNETDDLTLSSPDLPSFGTLTDNGDGTGQIVFDPAEGDEGTYTVTVEVSDTMVTTSTTFTVTAGVNVASLQGGEETGSPEAAASAPDEVVTKDSGGGLEDSVQEERPDFDSLTVSKLDVILGEYELSQDGKKADKVQRISEYYDGASSHEKIELKKKVEEA